MAPNASTDDRSGAAGPRGRILVVEDDYFIALELEHRLTGAGHDVVGIAATADEAMEMAAAERPDLAIMDIRLAGPRDGIDAAIELSSKLGVPSIFATAHGDEATRRRAEKARSVGWLQKPYSATSLIDLVNEVLAKGG